MTQQFNNLTAMSDYTLKKQTLQFLKDVAANNNRDWFAENRPTYQTALADFKGFVDALINKMSFHDAIEGNKAKVFRIYRDVRFSKNKEPYKSNFSAGMQREGKMLRGGYYLSLQPGASMVGGGFFQPEKEDLLRIRQDIARDDTELRRIINDPTFKELFGELGGDKLKSSPRDFPKDHPAIDLINHKSFIVTRNFTDKEVLSESFLEEVVRCYIGMRPFFDYMSDVLTTDENGEVIV